MANRHPCCGALKGLWHNEDCFERKIFPDDIITTYHGDLNDVTIIEKRGETYKKLKEEGG